MQLKRWAGLCAVLVLAGCPSMSSGPSLGGSWREVGVSQNGNMRYEIDTSSIRKEGSRVSFRERITVAVRLPGAHPPFGCGGYVGCFRQQTGCQPI